MTKRGALTEYDNDILDYLRVTGPATTREIQADVDTVPYRRVYERLRRLHHLGHLSRQQVGNSTPVLWWIK